MADNVASKVSHERIYVSRSRNPQRPLTNELEVEKLVTEHGFVVVCPEGIPLQDQINMFKECRLLIGPSGSNLFNMAFAEKIESAFVLLPPNLVHHSEVLLGSRSCSNMVFMMGTLENDGTNRHINNVHAPWNVDIDSFKAHFLTWLTSMEG